MGTFNYSALDAHGKLVNGFLEGDSGKQVRHQLRSQQLKPVAVSPASDTVDERKLPAINPTTWFKPRLKPSDLALLTRQMATLIEANIPIDEALSATAKQSRKPRVQSLVLQLRARVVEGHSLAYALGDFPHVFNEMYRAMVKAGEHAGFLGRVLKQLADYTESRQYSQQKLKMAMVYPLLLTLVAVAVVAVLMVLVVPQLVELFTRTNQALPWLTQTLIALSDFLVSWWWLLLLLLLSGIALTKALLRSPGRRSAWHALVFKMPFISSLITSMETARFASTLSILVSSGVPLLDGLRIAGSVFTNMRLRESGEEVVLSVQEGSSLNRALERTSVFPTMMVHMVASGEASGNLETMLERSAINQERELEMILEAMMSIFTPVLILCMAAVVGAIVLAILLPIIEMNNLVV